MLAEEVSHKTKCTISPPETRTGRRLRLPDAAQAQAESPISAPGQIPDKPLKLSDLNSLERMFPS